MRRLIINADDFGLTHGINRAIVEGCIRGVVTSATIMANAPAFPEVSELARNTTSLRTGCHIVMIDGEAVTGPLPSLTNGSGHFRDSLKDFARAALGSALSPDEIEREAEAQIRKIQSTGINLTHVDSHKHTHMFPKVLRPLLRAAKRCGIRAVRNPFEPFRSWPRRVVMTTPSLWLRSAGVATFQCFAGAFRRIAREEEIRTTDGTVGIAVTGKLDQKAVLAMLNALPEGTWELVCHPGYADDDLRRARTRLVEERRVELDTLTSDETRKAIAVRGIKLISYAEL